MGGMVVTLRPTDRRILAALELDARTPFSAVGKRLRRSQQQVSYTVNAMIQRGLVPGFFTAIDYSKLGVLHFRVYFRVNYTSEEEFERLIRHLVAEEHTSWIVTCGSRYDLIATFLAENPSRFNKVLRAVMARFPRELGDYSVLTTVVIRLFGRKYLFPKPGLLTPIILGGDRERESLDDLDLRLLHALSREVRASAVSLAHGFGVSSKTIIQRIKRLRERLVIRAFKPQVNTEAMGITSALLLVRYHNISSEAEEKLIAYLEAHPNVVSAVKTLGEWDLEIEIESEERNGLRRIEIEIRRRFVALIKELASIPLYYCYKKSFFPDFLLPTPAGEKRS